MSSKQIPPRAARIAVSCIFFAHGTLMASWASRIPSIQQQLHLDAGTLGIALWGAAVGSLSAFPITSWLIARLGSRVTTIIGGLVFCVALVLLALAPSSLLLWCALWLFGVATNITDISMNAQGAAVEGRYGRPIMSSLHGLWSAGSIAGASIGGIMAGLNIAPLPHFLTVFVVLCIAISLAARWLLPIAPEPGKKTPIFARPTKALLALGFLALCSFMCEGAMADWSAVYLHGTLGASTGIAAAGFAIYSLAMTIARLGGDRVTQILGAVRQVQLSGLLSTVGLGLALLVPYPAVAMLGFALVGAGLACVAPLVFSTASRTPGMSPGIAMVSVVTVAYSGSLIGPPLIGHMADLISLRGALGLVVLLSIATVLLARTVGSVPSEQGQVEEKVEQAVE